MRDQPSTDLDESFARETGRLVARGWRIWLASYLVLAAADNVMEWRADPARGSALLAICAVQAIIVAAGWFAMRRRTTYPGAAWVALGSNLSICFSQAVYNLQVGGDTFFELATFLSFLLLSVVFLPWGMRFQAAQSVGIIAAYGLALPPGTPLPVDDFLAFAVGAVLSSLGASSAHRLRRRQFEQNSALQHANERLQAAHDQALRAQGLLELLPIAVTESAADGALLSANPAAVRMFGYSDLPDLLAANARSFYADGADRERLSRRLSEANEVSGLELRFHRKDGSIVWVRANAHGTLDDEGRLVRVSAALEDVTARRMAEDLRERAEQALRESEEKFRTMIETAPDPISLSDLDDGEYLEVNAAWCAFTGLARAEVIGRTTEDLSLWVDPEERRGFGRALKHDGAVRDLDARLRGRGGAERIGSLSATRLRLGGRDVAMVWTRDVTEQRRAEEALRESEERFRSLATFAPIGIFRTDAAGRVVYTNPLWQQLAGLGPQESLGEGYAAAIHPEDRQWVVREWERCAREAADFDHEFRFRRADGAILWVHTTTTALRSPDGAVLGFIGTNQDISERKAVEQMRADLIRMLSHDIKNPLSLVLGFADLLREDLAAGRDPGAAIDAMESSARDAMALALNFLDADRVETGSLPLRKTPASLNEIAKQEVQRQAPRARLREVELRADLDASMPSVDLDEALVGRVVANLLSNAIKFSPAHRSVHVRTRSRDGRAFLAVQDSGPGIGNEDRERLFRRYGRGSTAGTASTGLGLFVVKTVVEAHGGGVEVHCPPQGGASFEIWFPAPAADR